MPLWDAVDQFGPVRDVGSRDLIVVLGAGVVVWGGCRCRCGRAGLMRSRRRRCGWRGRPSRRGAWRSECGMSWVFCSATMLPARGKRAWSPGRLVMVLVLQFVEGLTDRQAAEAVRARIDWKFALGSDRRGRHALLRMIWADDAPPALRELPEAGTLRQVWVQPFHLVEGEVQRRDPKDRPPGAMRLVTLHDAEARSGGKRDIYWDGSAPRRRRAPSSVGSCGLVDQRPDGRATRAGGSCRSVPGHEGDWLPRLSNAQAR